MDNGKKRELLLLAVFLAAAAVITVQRGLYEFPNDFAIFRASYWNLISHRDLYVLRLDQARDYFKYSPSFALLFAPFALPPFLAGLLFWNIVNALSIWLAFKELLPRDTASTAQALLLVPTMRSMQSSQSNALVAALMVFAFVCYEREWLWRAGSSVAVGTAIKIFPLAAVLFALPRRDRLRSLGIVLICCVVVVALPLLVLSPAELRAQYQWWGALEKSESTLVGSSVMQLLRDIGVGWPAWPIQLAGVVLLMLILAVRWRDWQQRDVRLQFLALTLVFCVVFNHRAERQSGVIAMSGLVIWVLVRPRTAWRTALFAAIYLLVNLSGADFVPDAIKRILSPELRFTIPLTIGWLAILGELVLARNDGSLVAEVHERDAIVS